MPLASAARGAPEPDAIDFTVSASLPPMVAGDVSGEMELSVPYLYPKPGVLAPTRYLRDRRREPVFVVRVQWWGDSGPGTIFKPGLLRGRDKDGERARRARMSKATCALFPVRCGMDGLLTYLSDMGSISLDILVHEGEPKGARRVGRCAIPVGSWSGQLGTVHPGRSRGGGGIVADGYYPVLSLDGNKYAGDLRVCLRACLGDSSKLRSVLAALAGDKTTVGAESREIIEALGGGGTRLPPGLERGGSTSPANARRRNEEEKEEPPESRLGSGLEVRQAGEVFGGGLPARASFDSADLTDGSSSAGPSPAAVAVGLLPPRGSAPLSSFQVNEALAKFDASDTLPVWPTPKGSLYRPPETRGEAAPTPHFSQQKSRTRGVRNARSFGASVSRRKITNPSPNKIVGVSGRGESSPPATRVGAALTGETRMASMIGGSPLGKTLGRMAPREFRSSVSPERQAPDPARPDTKIRPLSGVVGGDRGSAGAPTSERPAPPSQRTAAAAADAPASEPLGDVGYLSKLLNRGKDLREKMTIAAAASNGKPLANSSPPPPSSTTPLSAAATLAGLAPQHGLFSRALLDSSLRDDIEGIFDTLSDDHDGPATDNTGVLVRDPETRGNEGRVVDLLLAAAGPPPSSLVFPALAAVERKRADSLARVRFLRIRLSRLVMFGSMTSSTEGHGWQLRFRLPAFVTPPGRGNAGGGGSTRRTAAAGSARNARVVAVPVPPRVSVSTLGKSKTAAVRRGRSTSGTAASSVLRVRRGFGACDLVVGETSLLEEVVCAVDVDDACVTQWMDTAVEFLLVDGRTDGAPRARQLNNHPHLQQRRRQSSTVGPGDRVAAVATLPLRDLVLSAELGVAATLDLVEVSDFWAAEDARAAASASGRRGRGGRPLRHPYRSEESTGGARPLVLGDRAIGALAVALELVPGEPDVSPEHSRPEVERWSRQQGEPVSRAGTGGGGQETPEEGSNREDASLMASSRGRVRTGSEASTGGRDSDAAVTDDGTRVSEAELGASAEVRESRGEDARENKHDSDTGPPGPLTARLSSSLEGSWKDAGGTAGAGLLDMDYAVLLRIDDLGLAPSVGLKVDRVRVAYSFTQVEGYTPTVTHRSVTGHRAPPPSRSHPGDGGEKQQQQQQQATLFTFGHEEIFPAPTDSSTWRLASATSRVFEVWGSSSDEGPDGSEVGGHAETLLGLAKVSLKPFAAFDRPGRRSGEGSDDAADRSGSAEGDPQLSVGADGLVPVSDPFSGRTLGELRIFLALGASSRIAALSGGVAPSGEEEKGGGEPGGTTDRTEGYADRMGEGGSGEREGEGVGGLERLDVENEGGGGVEDFVGGLVTQQDSPALDDSLAELSMLLNPGRAERVEVAERGRSSGGFTGLVRHVVELSAVGELPFALDVGTEEQEHADEPMGCAIEYVLPAGQARLDLDTKTHLSTANGGQTHELWWDADSAVLNSRARHTVKVPGSLSDHLPVTTTGGTDRPSDSGDGNGGSATVAGDRSLNGLLDCMFGREDVVLSLFWSAGVRQGGTHGDAEGTRPAEKQRRSPLGRVVLRRADLLPLVRRTSSRVVLRLPIEPTDGSDKREVLPAPEVLPLSISYRREPSAVARRKSRSSRAGLGGQVARAPVDGRGAERGSGEMSQFLDALSEIGSTAGNASRSTVDPSKEEENVKRDETIGEEGEYPEQGESPSWPHKGDTTGVEVGSNIGGSADSCESDGDTLGHRSSGTELLLPARTKLCVRVENVVLTTCVDEDGGGGNTSDEILAWVSFAFPGPNAGDQAKRQKGGVFLWKPADEQARQREVHWSPAILASRDDGHDRVAPLGWSMELPVTIDAAFVEYVRTQSLELHVWTGRREDWPAGGATCGVAKVVLSSLLTTIEGAGGDMAIVSERSGDGSDSGCITARVFFKHRGLGPNDDARPSRACGIEAVSRWGVASARGRPPVSFREEVEVLGQDRSGSGSPDDDDGFASGNEIIAPIMEDPALQDEPVNGRSSEQALEEEQASAAQNQSTGVADAAEQGVSSSSGLESVLEVYVERAMRLLAISGDRAVEADVAAPENSPPSTYVTFRWEEEGRSPLRSPLVPRGQARSTAVGGDTEEWQDTLTADGEIMTPIVENSSNPTFDHTAQLRLLDPSAWGRVCGPSAALVFRVWHRARCSWWDAPQLSSSDRAEPPPDCAVGERITAASGSRFGDKLIGSAVVGLEVLRGAIGAREGLRLIDGWYHVLDDLQRPQGQIKVRVRPQPPPSSARDQSHTSQDVHQAADHATTLPVMPVNVDSEHNPLTLLRAALGPSPETMSTEARNGDEKDAPTSPRAAPPLHDTQTHLRSVHALLDSLPPEFRSTQPRRPSTPASVSSAAKPISTASELPSPSEEPRASAERIRTASAWPPPPSPLSEEPMSLPSGRAYGGETSGMPELRRMLSSLDRIDRRLFALGGHGDDHDVHDSDTTSGDANDAGCKRRGRTSDAGDDETPTGSSTADDKPTETTAIVATGIVGDGSLGAKRTQDRAVFRLQRAWRARSNKRRLAAEAEAERKAFSLRQKRREEAAATIQSAHRRAQARYRIKRAAEERRRWGERQRRRAAACAVLERAWRAFQARRRAARELAEARARVAAAVAAAAAAARREQDTARAAVLVQAVWRGMSARTAVARRFEASRARWRAAAAAASAAGGQETSSRPAPIGGGYALAAGMTTTPRSRPSTFYNQLSQDPRRSHRLQLPEAHLAAAAAALPPSQGLSLPPAPSLAVSHSAAIGKCERKAERPAGTQDTERFGGRPLGRSAGATRPPRFADKETARIARIMKGNLQQHWASARSSSSSDDVDL